MNLGMPEMLFLFLLGLLLFGPKKLPEIGRQVGKALGEFKRASNEFQAQLNHEVRQLEIETEEKTIAPAKPSGATERTELPAYMRVPQAAGASPMSAQLQDAAIPDAANTDSVNTGAAPKEPNA